MKKCIVIFICILTILMVSCGNPEDTDTNANLPADNDSGNSAAESNGETAGAAANENIFGAISEIVGNLATINLAVMPETGMPVPMNRAMFNPENLDPENLPEGVEINDDGSFSVNREMIQGNGGFSRMIDPENLPEGVEINEDGSFSVNPDMIPEGAAATFGGGDGQMRMFGGGEGEGGAPSMRNVMGGMLLDYTGEEKEFIIPVGLPIYALTRGEDGNEVETEIELGDVQAGNVINVAYKEDGKTIDKITVSQITALKPSEVEEMKNRINEFTANGGDNADISGESIESIENTENNADEGGN